MKAILLPYSVDQNEPSKPLKMVVDLPDNKHDRDMLLRQVFRDRVSDVPMHCIKVYEPRSDADFGDLIVEGTCDIFMFVTFLLEIPDSNQPVLFHATGSSWTKHRVFDQLTSRPKRLKFKADQIPDDIMQEWVDREQDLKDQFISEEAYAVAVKELNATLVTKTMRAILEN